jgi:F-type H+-transporting ATPase subunit b
MPINWFTVVAQAINFLILVWLLKRFLYRPILNAIDAREKGIAARLAEAEAKKAEAQKERDVFQQKNEAFDQEHATLLQRTRDEASAERQRLLGEAGRDADALRAKRQEALRDEQQNLSQEITRWARTEVFAITRKTLTDLAATTLEERMTDVFVGRVRALNGPAKERLATSLKTSQLPVAVRSAFALPPEQHAAIQKALNESFSADIHIQFEVVPELVSGIEVSANGQNVGWSIADYLATLEKSAGELLHEDAKPKAEAGPKPSLNGKPKDGLEPVATATKANP